MSENLNSPEATSTEPQSTDMPKKRGKFGTIIWVLLLTAGLWFTVNTMQQRLRRANKMLSAGNLRDIGLDIHNFHDVAKRFPFDGGDAAEGQGEHSWFTRMLSVGPSLMIQLTQDEPTIEAKVGARIDFSANWDSPKNLELMRRQLPLAIQPGISRTVDDRGLGLLHYAGNPYVLGNEPKMSFSKLEDGTRETVMVGEIADGFSPWGQPGALRDPAKGIHFDSNTYGSYTRDGALFLFCDGSIQFITNKIDPAILKTLANPSDGHEVDVYNEKEIFTIHNY